MREIKFRAWVKSAKKIAEVKALLRDSVLLEAGKYSGSSDLEDVELMQYTGLKDKNGREIYEGDIVRGGEFEESTHRWVYNDDPTEVKWSFSYKPGFDFPQMCEVIGNIYENKDLLEA